MMTDTNPVPFITFEGGEGAGKSTQIRLLSDFLKVNSIPHIVTREPGGSVGAEAIRDLLVNGEVDRWNAQTETLLFMTARFDHIQNTIKPALSEGKWVLCDRYMDSTRIYQSVAKSVDTAWTESLFTSICDGFEPDITLLLDIAPVDGLKRANDRNSGEGRFESMDIEFHQRVRSGFLELAQTHSNRFEICDASQEIDALHHTIREAITRRFLDPQEGT